MKTISTKTRLFIIADLLQMPLNFNEKKGKLEGKQVFRTASFDFEYELSVADMIEYPDDSLLTLMSLGIKGQKPSPLMLLAEIEPGSREANVVLVNRDKLGADFPGWKLYESSREAIDDLGLARVAAYEIDPETKVWVQAA